MVAPSHGQKLDTALRSAGVESGFNLIAGSQHGEALLGNSAVRQAAVAFLRVKLV
jgi:hypothetical protein